MGKRKKRIGIDGDRTQLESNPFGGLDLGGLPESKPAKEERERPASLREPKTKNRGRVDVVRRRSAGSGGWMTVAKNFVGISNEEKTDIKKRIQKRCGVGGTLKGGNIEIQGDRREDVKAVLEQAGFRVVFAGG